MTIGHNEVDRVGKIWKNLEAYRRELSLFITLNLRMKNELYFVFFRVVLVEASQERNCDIFFTTESGIKGARRRYHKTIIGY